MRKLDRTRALMEGRGGGEKKEKNLFRKKTMAKTVTKKKATKKKTSKKKKGGKQKCFKENKEDYICSQVS